MRLNKNFKKALSAVLASAMVFSFAPVVNADDVEPIAGDELPNAITINAEEVDFKGAPAEYTYDATGSLAGDWSGNFGYIKSNYNFEAKDVTVTVNNDYVFSFGDIVSDKRASDTEKDEAGNYKKNEVALFGENYYGVDLPNIWNFGDGDVMATSDDGTAKVICHGVGTWKAVLTVNDEEVAIESAELSFKFDEAPAEFTPFQIYIGGNFNSGWNQEFIGDAKLGSKEAGDADDAYYLDIAEPGDYAFEFIASEGVTDVDVAYTNIANYTDDDILSVGEFARNAKITWKGIYVQNEEGEEIAAYPFVKDQSLMYTYWDGEPTKGVRYNLANKYNAAAGYLTDDEEMDAWGEVTAEGDKDGDGSDADFVNLIPETGADFLPSEIVYEEGDHVFIKFTVEAGDGTVSSAGITELTDDMTTTPEFEPTVHPGGSDIPGPGDGTPNPGDGTPNPGDGTPNPSTNPSTGASVAPTKAPAKVATKAAVVTPAAASLKVAKKVVVAAGKTKDVKVTVDPSTFSAITATSANEKLVTVATAAGVVKVTATAAAKKNKGKVVKVTVKAGDKEQIVKVAIQNKAKKLKAAKKVVTVKKGKKAKVTFKVTAENKKAAATDLFAKAAKAAKKAAKIAKVAKVQSVKVKKGKAIVTIKATKKTGTKPLTLKLGKAKAKCKVTVK